MTAGWRMCDLDCNFGLAWLDHRPFGTYVLNKAWCFEIVKHMLSHVEIPSSKQIDTVDPATTGNQIARLSTPSWQGIGYRFGTAIPIESSERIDEAQDTHRKFIKSPSLIAQLYALTDFPGQCVTMLPRCLWGLWEAYPNLGPILCSRCKRRRRT